MFNVDKPVSLAFSDTVIRIALFLPKSDLTTKEYVPSPLFITFAVTPVTAFKLFAIVATELDP